MPWHEAVFRAVLALGFGMVIGLDRDIKNKPIDFRAYMIVAVTTCMVGILGQELYADFSKASDVLTIDLAKIIEGALTGIGFLGAGAIIKINNKVVGTATGASIWAAGSIGLCLGFGAYILAFIAFGGVAVTLIIFGAFMKDLVEKHDKIEEPSVTKEHL